jgi:hypothetical protein
MRKAFPAVRRRALNAVILCSILPVVAGCLITTIHVAAAPPHAGERLLQADRDTVWTALLQVAEAQDIRILESDSDRGWLRTDFVYFRPMEFGEPVLDGTTLLGNYINVKGGRYRLTVRLTADGEATRVHVEAEVERLEASTEGKTSAEPSFSLDAETRRRSLVKAPQRSNGVIERRFLADLEKTIAGGGAPHNPLPAPHTGATPGKARPDATGYGSSEGDS